MKFPDRVNLETASINHPGNENCPFCERIKGRLCAVCRGPLVDEPDGGYSVVIRPDHSIAHSDCDDFGRPRFANGAVDYR